MKSIGLDIGTTTVCGIVIDAQEGRVLDSITLANDSAVVTSNDFEKIQDVRRIMELCEQIIGQITGKYEDISAIGVTGQMHGILYVDEEGNPVSPLYSWQDERGNQQYQGEQTYCEYLTEKTGYRMATGYGLTTHFYNWKNECIPKRAACFCTIADYAAMRLAKAECPLIHKSMAASIGLFDIQSGGWDTQAMAEVGLELKYLPVVSQKEVVYDGDFSGIKVSTALGDNQASFLGSVNTQSNILVNVGTGSQISIFTEAYDADVDIEYRPFIADTYLMVGSPLCGGASYAMLKGFYENVLRMFGCEIPEGFYTTMNEAAERVYGQEDRLVIDTRFNGTRANPDQRGSIKQMNRNNFSPEAMTVAMLRGICDELYTIFAKIPKALRDSKMVIGSGNGIRQNPVLQQAVEDTFSKSLSIPVFSEEASYGAALYALYCSGEIDTLDAVKEIVQTKPKI